MVEDYPSHSLSDFADSDSSSAAAGSSERSHNRSKGRHFVNKYGSKIHSYEPTNAPWPVSYDKASLELEMMDTALVSAYPGVVSLVDHKGKEPARCLDLGTGLGLWVTQSAKYWRNSTFVGFDLVNVQVPLSVLEPDEANRIEWVYGNVLSGPLPFKDEEFEHVRITEIALGVPENKWSAVFEELRRVMKPGATIEIIEEDAIFPVLPRWFTEPLHARTRWPAISMQDGTKFLSNPQTMLKSDFAHAYELLEILFNKVFDRRFINTKPSSTLPAYFSTYFSHVISPPILSIPMPPFPPVQARPAATTSFQTSRVSVSSSCRDGILFDDSEAEDEYFPVPSNHDIARSGRRSTSVAPFLSSPLVSAAPVTSSPLVRSHSENLINTFRNDSSASLKSNAASHHSARLRSKGHAMPPPPPPAPAPVTVSTVPSYVSAPEAPGRASTEVPSSSVASKRTAAIQELAALSTTIGERSQIELFPIDSLLMFDMHSLCLHLRRALGFVLGVREAMWEELQSLVASPRKDVDVDLTKYGFFPHEDTMQSMRSKYEQLLEQYKSDMHVRLSLWQSLVHFGWDYPLRDPMSQAEEMEEIRLREDILMARRKAGAEDEREPPCRAVRVLVGAKGHTS